MEGGSWVNAVTCMRKIGVGLIIHLFPSQEKLYNDSKVPSEKDFPRVPRMPLFNQFGLLSHIWLCVLLDLNLIPVHHLECPTPHFLEDNITLQTWVIYKNKFPPL